MITFIGQIDGAHIKAAVLFNDSIVSIDGPLWFTLDEWHELRRVANDDDQEDLWVTTPAEYEQSIGEPSPV